MSNTNEPQREENADAYFERGRTSFENREYNTAIENLTKAIEMRGKAYFGKGDLSAAKKDLDKALEISPSLIELDEVKGFKNFFSFQFDRNGLISKTTEG